MSELSTLVSLEAAMLPLDQAARDAALDVTRSWIVQAPAGAGKTELLTQRILKLLAIVDEPEEILAITFTRAATAEMRGRVIAALEEAAAEPSRPAPVLRKKKSGGPPQLSLFDALEREAPHDERPTLALARAALQHAQARGWQLLQQPHRLDVQTIDSLCLRLAHGQPLLARLGGQLAPTEQAAPLYALAAERTFALLGRAPSDLDQALRQLLLLRDNNLGNCHRLIAAMLGRREQWQSIFPLGEQAAVNWDEVRAQLEAPFAAHVSRILEALHAALAADPTVVRELLELAQYACSNGSKSDLSLLDGLQTLPAPHADFVRHWQCLRNFLLVKEGGWRKSIKKIDGFPVDKVSLRKKEQVLYRDRMTDLLARLQKDAAASEQLRNLLCSVSTLPASHYEDAQWQTLLSVFRVLRQAAAELHVVFAERNQVDFAELSIAAATVLDDEENPRGMLASESRRHLLIDEFQDTSRIQHQLVGRLLREWRPANGRTCFLVGDPMQSIYIFRQAEVELFGRVQRRGIDCGSHAHPCSELTLSENFRSHAGLVNPLNAQFTSIFTAGDAPGEVVFSPSIAAAPAGEADAVHVHAFFAEAGNQQSRDQARKEEAARIVKLVREHLPHIAAAEAEGKKSYTVAVLGRAKNHLAPIAAALRAEGIRFRAVELETLAERQEILDLQSLLRALLHPADRVAWLSVLRAPWCGLTLGDLHTLTGSDDDSFRRALIPELMTQRAELLTHDGRLRLGRVASVLERAATERFGQANSLAAWLERTWTSLGAPAYLHAGERENAEVFFRLLDDLTANGADSKASLQAALAQLCAAPDGGVSEHFGVQLMTIHKAKGLGFDVVIVPALERATGNEESPLVTMLQRARHETDAGEEVDELLVAPLGRRGEQHSTYKWVQTQRRQRAAAEHKRLYYVACTRARQQLHLLGTATVTAQGRLQAGAPASLLHCAWPALGAHFQEQYRQQNGALPVIPTLSEMEEDAEEPALSLVPPFKHPALPPSSRPESQQGLRPGLVLKIAAASTPAAQKRDALQLWRVPAKFAPSIPLDNVTVTSTYTRARPDHSPAPRFNRPEGSFEQRARGNAVHAMLQLIGEAWARTGATADPHLLESQLARTAQMVLRGAGLAPAHIDSLAQTLLRAVLAAASHAEGRWILSPHPEAQFEASWSHWSGDAAPRTLRVDRAFRAGPEPLMEGSSCLWVIDYKTGAHPGNIALDAYLEGQKEQWRPQLEAYGAALRAFHGGQVQLRYGLYFPELLQLKWWQDNTLPT